MFSELDILQYWIYKGKLVKSLCFFRFIALHYIIIIFRILQTLFRIFI